MTPILHKLIQDTQTKLSSAHQLICDLASGRKRWLMQIPANRAQDSDLLLSDAVHEGNRVLQLLEMAIWELTELNADEAIKRLEAKIQEE